MVDHQAVAAAAQLELVEVRQRMETVGFNPRIPQYFSELSSAAGERYHPADSCNEIRYYDGSLTAFFGNHLALLSL